MVSKRRMVYGALYFILHTVSFEEDSVGYLRRMGFNNMYP
jgi:hypothetical protein